MPERVQFHIAVNPITALVAPAISIHAKPVGTLPEIREGMPPHNPAQLFNQCGIS